MNSSSIIAIIALAVIVFLAVRYIVKEKKRGTKCIGCPYAGDCRKHSDMRNTSGSCCH